MSEQIYKFFTNIKSFYIIFLIIHAEHDGFIEILKRIQVQIVLIFHRITLWLLWAYTSKSLKPPRLFVNVESNMYH